MSYSWQIVGNNFDSLTASEKEELFINTNYRKPTIDELKALGEFKVAVYDTSSSKPTVSVVGVPQDQLVLPKNLISLSAYGGVNNVSITHNLTGSAEIKLAVTLDKETYYTLDSSGEWVEISLDNVYADGLSLTKLTEITRNQWDKLLTEEVEEFGFCFLLHKVNPSDEANIDNLILTVEMRGRWVGAVHGTEYNYEYIDNTTMRVTITNAGTYKINY